MQFPRNFTPSHRTDKVQRNAVILFPLIEMCSFTHQHQRPFFSQSCLHIRMVSIGHRNAYCNTCDIFGSEKTNHFRY